MSGQPDHEFPREDHEPYFEPPEEESYDVYNPSQGYDVLNDPSPGDTE